MTSEFPSGCVVAVSVSAGHDFSKQVQQHIRLLTKLGVEGDVHLGVTVKPIACRQRSQPAKFATGPPAASRATR